MNRKQFIGFAGSTALMLLAGPQTVFADKNKRQDGRFVFLEAEGFADFGGCELDQQPMDIMGSPYLLAHGLGIPVKDAVAEVTFPAAGTYRLWGIEDPLGNLGGWFWESGFNKKPITDVELIRDLNFRAMYGAWDTLKNVDKLYPNHRLGWAAYIAGKRESRRLLGDVILTADDFRNNKQFPDPAFPCSWHIDLHSSDNRYDKDMGDDAFISIATDGEVFKYEYHYWAPYRVLYSRNIPNLFMAGRNISVSKEGLGPVRVMRTCGMTGEIIGKAAAICIEQNTSPGGVYENHLARLQKMMQQPSAKRTV